MHTHAVHNYRERDHCRVLKEVNAAVASEVELSSCPYTVYEISIGLSSTLNKAQYVGESA